MRGSRLGRIIDFYLGVVLLRVLSVFRPRGRKCPESPEKILVILLGAVGDTLLLVPAMRLLKKKYPGSRVYFFCTGVNRSLAGYLPGIDETVSFEFGQLLKGPAGIYKFFKLIQFLRGREFDLVIDFEKWVRISALVSFLAGSGFTVGFRTKGQYRHFCYDLAVEKAGRHVAEVFLDLVRALPPAHVDAGADPVFDRGLIREIRKDGPGIKNYVIIHPGAGGTVRHGFKRIWPPACYAMLAGDIAAGFPGVSVVFTGTAGEAALVDGILSLAPGLRGRAVFLAGKTGIRQVFGLVSRACLVVCGNTGIMHLAVALDVPVVALHGPTDPEKWGPLGAKHTVIKSPLPCSPCLDLGFEYRCHDARCMESIDYREVLQAVCKVLQTLMPQ